MCTFVQKTLANTRPSSEKKKTDKSIEQNANREGEREIEQVATVHESARERCTENELNYNIICTNAIKTNQTFSRNEEDK